jgi:pyruvate/2-oxoglutarate dehydrogenase complex dihydrolipoamide acyltransferase (E2) component
MIDVELPKLAETQERGIITRWLRRPGDAVREGEPLVEVETDKVNSELEAPADGVLVEVLATEGARVPVGEIIARIDPGAAPTPR